MFYLCRKKNKKIRKKGRVEQKNKSFYIPTAPSPTTTILMVFSLSVAMWSGKVSLKKMEKNNKKYGCICLVLFFGFQIKIMFMVSKAKIYFA